jgi:hypothetical protein
MDGPSHLLGWATPNPMVRSTIAARNGNDARKVPKLGCVAAPMFLQVSVLVAQLRGTSVNPNPGCRPFQGVITIA